MSRRERRLEKILAHLRGRSEPIPSVKLANLLGVTDRTIRSDVATLGYADSGLTPVPHAEADSA